MTKVKLADFEQRFRVAPLPLLAFDFAFD